MIEIIVYNILLMGAMIFISHTSFLAGIDEGISREKKRRKKILIKALRQSIPKKRKNNV